MPECLWCWTKVFGSIHNSDKSLRQRRHEFLLSLHSVMTSRKAVLTHLHNVQRQLGFLDILKFMYGTF
jgi:hypothetical protein